MDFITINSSNKTEEFALKQVAKQATSSLMYRLGKTIILASVCVEREPVSEDFLPLVVQFLEKSYAAGKIPGGFVKREGRAQDFEILTSRLIDRTLRPLFPKDYRYPTQITLMVLSHDIENDLQVSALNAASAALFLSHIAPIKSVSACRIARIDNEFIINPSASLLNQSSLDLFVSGTKESLNMIEMRSLGQKLNALEEPLMLKALELAQKSLKETCTLYEEIFTPHQNELLFKESQGIIFNERLLDLLKNQYFDEIIKGIESSALSERENVFNEIARKISEAHSEFSLKEIELSLEKVKKTEIRRMIIKDKIRPDKRALEEVRPILIESDLLPMAHSSILFTRGQTQSLVVGVLGTDNDAQTHESLEHKAPIKERFMFHYNFPPFCVGEASSIGATSRRELGHGNLAKRALETSIKNKEQVIRLVSEILESNGSSSMASVCAGSLALYASGVEIYDLVAGVAMGMVSEGQDHAILSDISGLEDAEGDMDFKIAGNLEGITAMQMDTKMSGIQLEILYQALLQAKKAREHILKIMHEAKEKIVINFSHLPATEIFNVAPDKIVEIIGQGGRVIREIVEKFEVKIDLNKPSGEVKIMGNKERVLKTKEFILNYLHSLDQELEQYAIDEVLEAQVKRIVDFGAFLSLPKGGEGLLRKQNMDRCQVVLKEGDSIRCRVISFNKGKIALDLA
ncbi:polyribonucleotide nucleotidyltransferase [Helicobacter pylori]|uniref:polyribonucleotide nucleotidyltransferase n=1 Tax=Helicobacter pylori TaxID=210 RepID=UPI000EB2F9C5|nr:polyribonucleotide nucleotidyltransferase [Helicobacter pylori]TPI05155.1 polyribonucleotide nucleotidyltransferase [Helicobacter pylori]GHQ13436.1 polyribonucleotide nucleotidyltransferase [Helicobacter pylori]GHR25243.1 polyribonucleotide nucleotidyltransferase [Helicobacter pylori]GHR35388.1 polyribonucleotide nucleotidyltransferase [Helicobacter pylori]